jgi:UDP-N-acetylmuramoyl-tripeptide--D-alanyl-D-alanine ligase
MMMRLSEVALVTQGQLQGEDVAFDAVTTDSRQVKAGDLFVALQGERFDGHDYVTACAEQGAVAALVSKRVPAAIPQVLVTDTRLALGSLAAAWRGRFNTPLAAITGSNGKTTVKEMLAAILRAAAGNDAAVLATQGNLNNDIGLPMTLLRLQPQHQYAVAEMGMNHAGEIAYLTRIAEPTVALINNALPAHLEGLGSVEGVARAKGEIFEGLADDGTAIINADDAFAALWRQLAAPHRIVTFGLEATANVSAGYALNADSSRITLRTPQGEATLNLPAAGLHNVRNALAATAAALAMGVSLQSVVAGLEGFSGAKGRQQRKAGLMGAIVIDDTYNANPASMKAAIDVLAACPGERILVLGAMGELGADAEQLHAEIGAYARHAGLTSMLTLGDMSRLYGGTHFETPEALAAALKTMMTDKTTVLVKGSRFMRMERVVDLITESQPKEARHAA